MEINFNIRVMTAIEFSPLDSSSFVNSDPNIRSHKIAPCKLASVELVLITSDLTLNLKHRV